MRSAIRLLLAVLALPACMSAQAADTPAPPSPPEKNAFDIMEFRVLGNHALSVPDIERAVYPFLGSAKTIDTVEEARKALEKAYKDAGYGAVYVDIPEQTIDEGIVRLKVTEGALEGVHVHGARYFSGRQIRAALPALATGQTPHLPTLQEELARLNAQTPDRIITPILKAGSAPGTLDVDLNVKDTLPLHASIESDNRHTADTTPNRVTAAISYDNLWQRRDSLSLQYQTAPANTRNARVELANYLAHVGDSGGALAFSFTHTSSNVLALGTLGVLGRGTIYGLHWLQPLVATPESSADWNFGADYKDVATLVYPGPSPTGSGDPVSAPVHYINWSTGFDKAWRGNSYALSTTATLNFGVRNLVNGSAEFENTRAGGMPNYLYLRLSGQAMHALPAGFSLSARMLGQWSLNPLVNNEQFSLGGADTVRGYLEAETLGDSGVAGGLELHSPQLGAHGPTMLNTLNMFVFADGGVANLLEPLSSQNYSLRLWSIGAGLRLENSKGLSGSLDYALPESDGVRVRKHEGRVDFSLRVGF